MIITLADIEAEAIDTDTLINLTDKENLGVVNEARANGKIAGVCGAIEDLLRARYPVPLDPVPPIIKDIALKQATYEIYGLNRNFTRPKSVEDDYANATKLLEKIASGGIKLGIGAVETPPAPVSANDIKVASTKSVYTDDNLRNF